MCLPAPTPACDRGRVDDGWYVRDLAVTAVVFGMAAFVWFGWGQEGPPERWRAWLGVGSGVGLLVAA